MHFLILCMLSSAGIFIVFKSIDRFSIPSFPVIVINYLAATFFGFMINPGQKDWTAIRHMEWLPVSITIGVLFITMFFLVAYSTRKAGISVTTVASKMSVIIPILFSLIIDRSDQITTTKTAAILFTICGVAMTVYKSGAVRADRSVIIIPLILFVGMGVVDSLVKYAQHSHVNDNETALFSAVLFLNAFATGILILLFTPKVIPIFKKPVVWGCGLLLGGVNFGSIYFLVRALNYISPTGKGIDSSVIFGVNNMGIVALSVLAGYLIFKERLQAINWAGIAISAIALILFALG